MTSNGTFGGPKFAVDAINGRYGNGDAWKCFEGTTTYFQWAGYGSLLWYNPNALKIEKLFITAGSIANYAVTQFDFYGSNDNVDWEVIGSKYQASYVDGIWAVDVDSTEYYKYFKLTITGAQSNYPCIGEVNMKGIYKEGMDPLEHTWASPVAQNYYVKY